MAVPTLHYEDRKQPGPWSQRIGLTGSPTQWRALCSLTRSMTSAAGRHRSARPHDLADDGARIAWLPAAGSGVERNGKWHIRLECGHVWTQVMGKMAGCRLHGSHSAAASIGIQNCIIGVLAHTVVEKKPTE